MSSTPDSTPNPRPTWNHTTPVTFSPVFHWPIRPKEAIFALTRRWVTISRNVLFLAMALIVARYFLPNPETASSLSLRWIAPIFLRNAMFMLLIAGGLHLYFFHFRAQGARLKYDPRKTMEKSGKFSFRNQTLDNMFWSLVWGASIWSLYEVLYIWAFANNAVPTFSLAKAPWAFVFWLLALPIVTSTHFYFIHRALHWPPLYKRVHRIHHRNIHIGPWAGMSMHPVEHLIYISSALIHFIIPSHPAIVLVHLYTRCLGPAFSHAGFEKLLVKDKTLLDAADFHHQLHHRYFECNYGTVDAPWDQWLHTDHDGSEEATQKTNARRKRMYRKRKTSSESRSV